MAVAANKRSVMTLFSGPTDIFSHQVRIVLAEKGVSVEIENVEAGNLPQDLIDLNPYQTVPTLVDRELTLYDSRVVMEYLDERFPHPPLMPVYPVVRGNSRLMIHRIDKDWYSLMHKIENKDPQADAARKQLREELIAISPIFKERPFFMSEEFSLVDCYLAPLLWRLPYWKIDFPKGKETEGIRSYMERVFERDSFLISLTEAEREMLLSTTG
ncbi:Stringent starvation protein A [Arsenophonus endosymbiont of Aleurodicus floccissimus]|uniref:stringent starvation protein SspA n=1 Tax=Arsenophonus endosymbiont of Aleurodicus floccissimus TaxID=2152761 RepID=UPI000E6AE811|nr:stringent starvation protein SspA [Arsenophonus endosymbiont of Aleurodicus floccissimus]SPP31899.1 Stringent starvation protein A [Arsenophonus endosymbiont of Aleurodicus floccissimus]